MLSKKYAQLLGSILLLFFGIMTISITSVFADNEPSEQETTLQLVANLQQEGTAALLNVDVAFSSPDVEKIFLVIKYHSESELDAVRFPNTCFGEERNFIAHYQNHPKRNEIRIQLVNNRKSEPTCVQISIASLTLVIEDVPEGIEPNDPIFPSIQKARVIGNGTELTPTILPTVVKTGKTNNELVKKQASEFLLFPNITKNSTNVTYYFPEGNGNNWKLYNMSGQMIQEYPVEQDSFSGTQQLDLSNLSNGIYFLEAVTTDQQRLIQKVIKQ